MKPLPITPPDDFPRRPYIDILARVSAGFGGQPRHAHAHHEFVAAWTGALYRFCACDAHTTALIDGFATEQHSHEQEQHLFGVFNNGVATLESVAYGVFAIGALIRPDIFLLDTPTARRNATIGATLRLYAECFHDDELTRVLFWRYNHRDFGWWKDARNQLAKQTLALAPQSEWSLGGVAITAAELAEQRSRLSAVLHEILIAVDDFWLAQESSLSQ
ncbi:MAG: hypothetical protein ACT4O1_10345 [Gemmatimonadota bacterium]